MTVHLVGAGPGDPELLTVKAVRLIGEADVIVHDYLSNDSILELAKPGTEFIDVGKKPGNPTPQELINALLVHLGAQGKNVVRLKGGDPFVFGRGGEEAQALMEARIHAEGESTENVQWQPIIAGEMADLGMTCPVVREVETMQ